MQRSAVEGIAHQMMEAATMHLTRDGHVAFAPIIIKNGMPLPIQCEMMDKAAIGTMLRRFAKNADAIVLIDEIWLRPVAIEEKRDLDKELKNKVSAIERREGFFVNIYPSRPP